MSDDKDDLRSIKVYKFSNTKENWHEFALKFRVIADGRGYEDRIDGTVTPPPPPPPPPMTRRTLKYSQMTKPQSRRLKRRSWQQG